MSASLFFGCNLFEGLAHVVYRDGWRPNIHLFTPLLPVGLSLIAALRHEAGRWRLATFLLPAGHYRFLDFLDDLGRTATGV